MPVPELRVSFADRAELERELEANLKHGRGFAKDADGVDVLADCMLLLVHPDDAAEIALPAQAVMICDSGSMRGIGLQLRPFDASVVARLEAFVAGVREPASVPDGESARPPTEHEDAAEHEEDAEREEDVERAAGEDAANDDAPEIPLATDVQAQAPRNERMRKLSVTEQQKIARSGELNDRVMLERIYGKAVWEGLLHNPKLTVPEVARIARKGTMPRPLLEFIVENNAWIQAPIVRRALLGNPRVSSEAILKLLRITPKHELRSIHKTSTYSAQVRECARKVLDL